MTAAAPNLWHHRDFLRLWAAYSVSLLGSQITVIAVPLTAIMLLGATPLEVGVVTACGYLPFLLIGLPVGVLVDRWRLRRLLIVSDVARAVVLGCVPLAYALGVLSIPLLASAMFVHGALAAFADTAHPSFLPVLVSRDQLVEGNTKLQGSYSVAEFAGPGLGGVLVSVLTAPFALLIDAASFLASGVILLGVRARDDSPRARAGAPLALRVQIREGLAYVVGHPLLRPLVASMAAANFFDLYGMVQVMLPIYAIRELELSPAGYGLAVSLANVGGLLGVLLNGRVVGRIGVGPAMLASSVLPGIGVLLLAVATPATALPVIVASLGLAGFGIAVFNVNQMSLRQHVTPAHMLGRMNATVRFIIWGMIPAGAFAGGVLMDVIGAGTALVIAGAGSLVSALPLVLSGFGAVRAMSDAEGAA